MGSEMDHFRSTIDLRAATATLAVNSEESVKMEKLARFDEFFEAAPPGSIIDSEDTFKAPEEDPLLIDF